MAEDANNVSANDMKQPENIEDGSREAESAIQLDIPEPGDVQDPEPKVQPTEKVEQSEKVGFDPPKSSDAVQEVASKIEDCESPEEVKESDMKMEIVEEQKESNVAETFGNDHSDVSKKKEMKSRRESNEDLSDLSDAQDEMEVEEEVVEAKEEEEIVASRDDELPVSKADAEPMVIEPIAFKRPNDKPRAISPKEHLAILEDPSNIPSMKIHTAESLHIKRLSNLDYDLDDILYCGHLGKKRDLMLGWPVRLFVLLKCGRLMYYKNNKKRCEINFFASRADFEVRGPQYFSITHQGKTWNLFCANVQRIKEWRTAFDTLTQIEEEKEERRRSIAESPSIIQNLDQFTKTNLDVQEDGGFGEAQSLDDEVERPSHICLSADDYQVKIPREAKSIIGLLDTALGADINLESLECSQASPWALDIIKTYVDWRLGTELNPIQMKVSAPVRDLLISDKFEVQLLNKIQAIEQIFELARSAEYLQIDVLLDSIYKYVVICLADGSEKEIENFLFSGHWRKPWYVTVENAVTPDIDEMEYGLDIEEDGHKIMLVPGGDESRKDGSKMKMCKYEGSIAKSLAQIQSDEFVLYAPFAKLPSHCWLKIAETSCVNRNFCITWKQAALSEYIVNFGPEERTIRVPQIDADSLNHVCRYLRHHNGKQPAEIAKPIRSIKMEKIVEDGWDATFINSFAKKDLFKLTLAANCMSITSLLHLTCAKVATMIKGKSPEEIKQILGEAEE